LVIWLPNSRVWMGWRQISASGVLCQRCALVPAQHGGDFGLAAGHEDDELRLLRQGEADRVVGGRVAGVQRGDDVHLLWRQLRRGDGFRDRQIEQRHPRKAQPLRQVADFPTSSARVSMPNTCPTSRALRNRS
jgi:hypothetical protein